MQSESYPPCGWKSFSGLTICAAILVALASPPHSAGSEPSNGYFVLLRNGEVIQGQLERDGDHYLVQQSGTATLRIPYKDISHVGPSLSDLYKHKANRIVEFRAGEHLDLASWCLQNGLEAQTTHHILRAESLDPLHSHLSLMKARLERYMQQRAGATSGDRAALLSAIGQEPIPFAPAPVRQVSTNRKTVSRTPIQNVATAPVAPVMNTFNRATKTNGFVNRD